MTMSPPSPISAPVGTGQSFIEVQFPVSKLSKESYKERMANASQTLTALGKWWGRKPLVLVRAIILGLLLPATEDPARDRAIFLKLMTMDDEGLWRRMRGAIPAREVFARCTPREREEYFEADAERPTWKRGLERATKEGLQRRAFFRMSYDEKLTHCVRPEEIAGPSPTAWTEINAHLGTRATNLVELVRELGERRFGHVPRVGDAFCGGGSIPFEAARLGCAAYGSDLNPVAALLTWAALNLVGGGKEAVDNVSRAQRQVYAELRRQVEEWGIERNEEGWVADAYLYCNEVIDPLTGWRVPLASSWIVSEKSRTIAALVPRPESRSFDVDILEGVDEATFERARGEGTWANGVRCPVDRAGNWLPPSQRQVTSFEQLRGRAGLRLWENDDLTPRPDDVFQERLYCIRWIETIQEDDGKPPRTVHHYRAPTAADLEREDLVLHLLRERFDDWQARGLIPSRSIEPGDENMRPTNGRGWTHWHHLFSPRQLLLGGLLADCSEQEDRDCQSRGMLLLIQARTANWSSRLSRWWTDSGHDKGVETFYNPSLNTPFVNYVSRPTLALDPAICADLATDEQCGQAQVELKDARRVDWKADIWVTDPGYADKVCYEELSEFFLAWYEQRLPVLFPDWYADSKRALAVAGSGEGFRQALSECYRNLKGNMVDGGFQVVMFTHQDSEIWADVTLVLWAAGLSVVSAWTIATETEAAGIKQGNYVQGTVVLVLRKRQEDRWGDLADVYPDIQREVQEQLRTMLSVDDRDDPNFGDADYQLAAYAAALRILTSYSRIGDLDVERELRRRKGERSELAELIGRAVKIASDYLVPDGLDPAVWRKLSPEERLYLKGVEVEAHGERREGVYQEFARGLGVKEYRHLLASGAANDARLKTPSELGSRGIEGDGFAGSLLRKALFAIFETARNPDHDPRGARTYLHQEIPTYWSDRQTIAALLRYLAGQPKPAGGMPHWATDAKAARLLLAAVETDRT